MNNLTLTPVGKLAYSVDLICISLGYGRKRERPEESHRGLEENMQTLHRSQQAGTFKYSYSEAIHCTTHTHIHNVSIGPQVFGQGHFRLCTPPQNMKPSEMILM